MPCCEVCITSAQLFRGEGKKIIVIVESIRKHIRFFVVGLMILILAACATINTPPVSVNAIDDSDADRVRFRGRGAGAGLMLSGTMGAMGTAIGIAIDEGIAKDIHATAEAGAVSFNDLLRAEISSQSEGVSWVSLEDRSEATRVYTIHEYGFVTVPGSSDEVYPMFELSIESGSETRLIRVPDDYFDSPEVLPKAGFTQIKAKAGEIERLWKEALALALN